MKNVNQSYAWRYFPGENGRINVNFCDWPKDVFVSLGVGDKITECQNRYFGVVGDASETIKNIGNGKLELIMRTGEGCTPRINILKP